MDSDYLNAVQAAYLGVNRQRIYQLAKVGRIGREVAGYRVFSREELDAFKAQPKPKGGRPRKQAQPEQTDPAEQLRA
jgi:hypothetical protein